MPSRAVVEPAAVLRALAREDGLTRAKYDANEKILELVFGVTGYERFRGEIELGAEQLPCDQNLLAILVALGLVDSLDSRASLEFPNSPKLEDRRRSLASVLQCSERSVFKYEGIGAERLALMLRWQRGIERDPIDGVHPFGSHERRLKFWMHDAPVTVAASLTASVPLPRAEPPQPHAGPPKPLPPKRRRRPKVKVPAVPSLSLAAQQLLDAIELPPAKRTDLPKTDPGELRAIDPPTKPVDETP